MSVSLWRHTQLANSRRGAKSVGWSSSDQRAKQLAVAGDGLQAIGLVTIPAKQARLTQTGGHHSQAHRICGSNHELLHWVANHGRVTAFLF
jgi:hypothetical protein